MSEHETVDLVALERRLRLVEDELAIRKLIASYGPSVDSARADVVADMWTVDGSYDVEGWQMNSREDVRAMVNSPEHRGLVANGCTHFLGPVVISIDGDAAVAICESLLVVKHEKKYFVARAGVHRFELVREPDTWRIQRRVSRTLDGSDEGHALLELP